MQKTVTGLEGEFLIDDRLHAPLRARLEASRSGGEGALPARTRLAFAAAHVVMLDSYRDAGHTLQHPGDATTIAEHVDWQQTMALRRRFDELGLGVAEAMDTAQRFYLGWAGAERLIRECGALNLRSGFIAGAGVDHLDEVRSHSDLIDGVVYQARLIQEHGGLVILLPLVHLTQSGASADETFEVYRAIIDQLDGPLFVHWLGEMFLPALAGYFPGDSFERVMAHDPAKVRGCKLSLLDDAFELRVRRELRPRGQVVLTGDDFNFGRLILGGDPGAPPATAPAVEETSHLAGRELPLGDFSHALLGILDGIAAPAALALDLLAVGDVDGYLHVMTPCEELGRCVFEAPTSHYKAGLAFLAWLNGWQESFMLVNREELARPREHYLRVAELAARAGALVDAELAASRLGELDEVLAR